MRRLVGLSLSVFLLSVCAASAQIVAIAWDTQPLAESYVVTVDGAQIANTTSLQTPWTPTAAYQRVCVASRAQSVTGQPACLDYGTPPAPPPPTGVEMGLTASPQTITQGSTSTLSYLWNAQTRHMVALDGQALLCTPVNNQCSGSQVVTPSTTTTYTMTAVLADGSPIPPVTTTVTVNPLAPPPEPPPSTHPPVQTGPPPVVTIRSCSEWVEAEKPATATGTGWVVQYFDAGTAITTASSTKKRTVTLAPGSHPISAVWSKAGQQPIQMGTVTVVCQ